MLGLKVCLQRDPPTFCTSRSPLFLNFPGFLDKSPIRDLSIYCSTRQPPFFPAPCRLPPAPSLSTTTPPPHLMLNDYFLPHSSLRNTCRLVDERFSLNDLRRRPPPPGFAQEGESGMLEPHGIPGFPFHCFVMRASFPLERSFTPTLAPSPFGILISS